MPQLDFSNPLTTSQVVWMFIIFAALYMALRHWALPQVGSVIEARESRIAADLDGARTAKGEADRAVAEMTERARTASAQAQAEVAAAVEKAKREAAERAKAETAMLDRQLADAEARIATARRDAMGALREVASETAAAVVGRLTGGAIDPARAGAAVADVMAARS